MRKIVQVRGLSIGEGPPKIIASLTGATRPALLEQTQALVGQPVHMAEWRVDHYRDAMQVEAVLETLHALRDALDHLPLLFTIRTKSEGGMLDLSEKDYARLIRTAANSGMADLVDVELSFSPPSTGQWIRSLHQAGALAVVSHHDFQRTPPEPEMVALLENMARTDADLLKLAVMPHSPADVLALLSATARFAGTADRPLITMSMGALGAPSRLCGETFGSAATFAAVGAPSAPGQLPARPLADAMELLHQIAR